MSRLPGKNCASEMISSENGATRPASDTDVGRLEVPLHEALLNPVHNHESSPMICSAKPLQNLVLGKDLEDLHGDATPAPAPCPPQPPPPPAAAWSLPAVTTCFLTEFTAQQRPALALATKVHTPRPPCVDEGTLHGMATVVCDSALDKNNVRRIALYRALADS